MVEFDQTSASQNHSINSTGCLHQIVPNCSENLESASLCQQRTVLHPNGEQHPHKNLQVQSHNTQGKVAKSSDSSDSTRH